MHPKIAAVQLNSSDQVSENLAVCAKYIQLAKQQNCSLVLLPENFSWMGEDNRAITFAEPLGSGAVQTFLSQQAKLHKLWLIAGGLKIVDSTKPSEMFTNTALVYNSEGECVCQYDKVHLFDSVVSEKEAYIESKTTIPGNKIRLVDTPVGKVALSICYDLRFPSFYQQLRDLGADVVVVPSAFAVSTGQAHWEVLLRARAIENQVYVIAAAQSGKHPGGRETFGHSMCIDAWGRITGSLVKGSGLISQEIDLHALTSLRHNMPVLSHRRKNLS